MMVLSSTTCFPTSPSTSFGLEHETSLLPSPFHSTDTLISNSPDTSGSLMPLPVDFEYLKQIRDGRTRVQQGNRRATAWKDNHPEWVSIAQEKADAEQSRIRKERWGRLLLLEEDEYDDNDNGDGSWNQSPSDSRVIASGEVEKLLTEACTRNNTQGESNGTISATTEPMRTDIEWISPSPSNNQTLLFSHWEARSEWNANAGFKLQRAGECQDVEMLDL